MLVQKKSKSKQILLLIISLLILGLAFYVLIKGVQKPDDLSFFDQEGTTPGSSLPIVDVDSTIFGEESLTQLKDRSGGSFTAQYPGTALDKDSVLPPENISVFNPQVGRKLVISWKNSDENNTIRIYRSQAQDEKGKIIAEGIRNETSYQDILLEDNLRYYYTVTAVNSSGKESENTNQVTGVPTDIFPPQSPTAVVVKNLETGKEIEISWKNPSDQDFDHVRIYRSQTEGEAGTLIMDQKLSNPSFIDDTVEEGVVYYYTLTAVDQSGNESGKSLLPAGGNNNPFEPKF